ncbi:hypothetical protein Tco_0127293 [Tanacetum coccineum]
MIRKAEQQYKNAVELEYHVDQLKAAVLIEAKWNNDEDDVSKPKLFERHMSKNTKLHPSFYNNDFYYLVSMSTKEKYNTSITKHYAHWEDSRIDFFKAEMSNKSEGKIYSDLRIKSVFRIVIRENLIYMVKKNKLGTGNKRLKGRDWTDMDVEKSNEMVDKIDKTLKRRE